MDNSQEYVGGHYDALAAIGVSFRAPNGSLDRANITDEEFKLAMEHLLRHFNVHCITIHLFWAELICDAVPEGRLPSSVGGLVAIWRNADHPAFMAFIGEDGELDEDESEESAAVAAGFFEDDDPTDAAIIKLADFFTDCQAITFLYPIAIIEFPPTDPKTFRGRLATLPSSIVYLPHVLRYHNGPLPNTPRPRRAQKPPPEVDLDETDYVERDRKFYPGAMISSVDKAGSIHASSAGILVENGKETRLTCSCQSLEHHEPDTQEARQAFHILQGKPGTEVGRVVRRVGTTDIALTKLNPGVKFENRFLDRDVQVTANKLVPSTNIAYYDELLINAFSTGVHRLLSVGSRIVFERGRSPVGDESLATFITARQGVCATGDPVLAEKPCIRDRACGAALFRCKEASGNSSSRDVLARGEVCGMVCYADLTPMCDFSASEYLIYTESFDSLIEEGWQVVSMPGEDAETNIQQL